MRTTVLGRMFEVTGFELPARTCEEPGLGLGFMCIFLGGTFVSTGVNQNKIYKVAYWSFNHQFMIEN